MAHKQKWKLRAYEGVPTLFPSTGTHYIQDGGRFINPGSRTWTTWSPATLNGKEEWRGGKGRIKPFCYEPLRLGSHQPILTDADIGHTGCSDDGMREARGDEQKR